MGCLTGFYLILKGDRSPKEIYDIILDAFESVEKAKSVPGTTPINCGNYRMHNLEIAKWHANEFATYLKENSKNSKIFEYPKTNRLITDSGRQFYDS